MRLPLLVTVISLGSSAALACVKDRAPNEPTCGHESRMAVAERHGFSELSHAVMVEVIQGNAKWRSEREAAYRRCVRRHNFCR
jgi:hypothetical protein